MLFKIKIKIFFSESKGLNYPEKKSIIYKISNYNSKRTTLLINFDECIYMKKWKFVALRTGNFFFIFVHVDSKFSAKFCIRSASAIHYKFNNSIWKFFADSCVTLPPKSSWYTWLLSFHIGALLCITNSLRTGVLGWDDQLLPFPIGSILPRFNCRC